MLSYLASALLFIAAAGAVISGLFFAWCLIDTYLIDHGWGDDADWGFDDAPCRFCGGDVLHRAGCSPLDRRDAA